MRDRMEEVKEHFGELLEKQFVRMEREERIQSKTSSHKIRIAICGGDGIGPVITKQAVRVLEYMLSEAKG